MPYIGSLSHHIKKKLSKLCKEFCKENFNIKLVFNSLKIKNYFSYKDPNPDDLKSFLVYKFTCASCSSSDIGESKLVFNSFKIKNYFLYKDSIPDDMKSFLAYKFTCAICSSSDIGETCRHFKTRIEEHIKKDNKSHIFKHLHSTTTCFDSYNYLCFKMIDKANSKFDLKIREALHIN